MNTVVPNNPYVGPRSIRAGEAFFGRDREIRSLSALLISERIVLLHSPSGAGKSSLIQAGLVPRMAERFSVFPLVRVNLEPPVEVRNVTGLNRYVLSTLLALEESLPAEKRSPLPQLAALTIDAYLEQRSKLAPAASAPDLANELLIFDQFEEVLTISPTDVSLKQVFFEQLGEALQDRRRWALFAIREDYMGGLAPYVRAIPNRLSVAFRLGLLGPDAARIAIQQPARNANVEFTDGAAQKLVDDLRRIQVQQPDGSFASEEGLNVEPVQLQVICFNLWQAHAADDKVIDESDLQRVGSVDQALGRYYANAVRGIARSTNVDERILRQWFDEHLITPDGIRSQVLKGAEFTERLPNIVLRLLENTHLIRGETRAGKTWYELSHDRLVKPVRSNNTAWFEKNLSLLQRQSVLWNQQGRGEGLLLRGKVLADAEKGLNPAALLTTDEQAFLAACQVLKKREQRDNLQKRIIVSALITSLVFLVLSVIGFIYATQQARLASISRMAAENAKATAVANEELAKLAQARAEEQARIARAGELAAQSVALRSQEFQVSLLLGIESFRKDDNAHTRGAMLDNVQTNPRLLEYITGYNSHVTDVVFSPNGQVLASAGCGKYDELNNCTHGEIRIWNTNENQLIGQPLTEHKNIVSSLAFSPDGKILASSGMVESIILWDTQNYRPIGQPFTGHQGNVTNIRFLPDGRTVLSVSCKEHGYYCTSGEILLWDVQSRQVINRPFVDLVDNDVIALSPDGALLALARESGRIILWDVQNQQVLGAILGHRTRVFSMAFSPDGKILAATDCKTYDKNGFCVQGEVLLWDTTSYQPIGQPLVGHTDYITDLVFNPEGTILMTSGWDSTILLWNMSTYQPIELPLRGHYFAITSVAASPDGKFLASGSWDKTVIVWDIKNFPFSSTADLATDMALSPDGSTLASGRTDKTITLRDTKTHQVIGQPLIGNLNFVNSVAFSPNGSILAAGYCEKNEKTDPCRSEILLWDVQTHKVIGDPLINQVDSITSLAFSPDGKLLASGSEDKTIVLWDVEIQQAIGKPIEGHNGPVKSVAFSPDGQLLASGSCQRYNENNCLQGEVMLWNVLSHQAIHPPLTNHKDYIDSIAFSPNGKFMAVGSWDKTITLWDTETWQPIGAPLTGHLDYVFSVVFGPDGETLASGSGDKTIILWDLTKPQRPIPIGQPLVGHNYAVLSLVFSPDGKTLFSSSLDNVIGLWDIDPRSWLDQTCKRVGRNFSREEWARYFPDNLNLYRATCSQWPLEVEATPSATP